MPLREPDGVDLRARVPVDVTPNEIEKLLRENIETPLRGRPSVLLEELAGDEMVVRVCATPVNAHDGSHLASEVLEVVARQSVRLAEDNGPRFVPGDDDAEPVGAPNGNGHAASGTTDRAPDGRPRRSAE